MPASGKKRARKAEEDAASKKKQKAGGADEPAKSPKRATARATATPALASPAPVIKTTLRKTAASKAAAKKAEEEEDTLGNPYEQERRAPGSSIAKKQAMPAKKKSAPAVPSSDTTIKTEPVMNGTTVKTEHVVNKRRNPTSLPCILLFLVAVLMWCTVTLLGLLLSERMDHELQVWHMRDLLHKGEDVAVPPPPKVEELEKNILHWKGHVEQLESQKKGMMQEFGEKLVSLEYME